MNFFAGGREFPSGSYDSDVSDSLRGASDSVVRPLCSSLFHKTKAPASKLFEAYEFSTHVPYKCLTTSVHLAAVSCDAPIAKIGFVDQQRV